MIAFVGGKVAFRGMQSVVIDANGIGYEIFMSQSALAKVPEAGSEVRILTYLHVREDAMVLYGFWSMEEKEAFERLIGVSGIGPKVALGVLAMFSPSQLAEAIACQDIALISKVPGIGKKTAGRIVLELKGSFESDASLFGQSGNVSTSMDTTAAQAATEVLLSLGFTTREIELALIGSEDITDEQSLVKYALRKLG